MEKSLNNQILLAEQHIEKIQGDSDIREIKHETQKLTDYLHSIRQKMLKLDNLNCKSISELSEPLDHKLPTEFMINTSRCFTLKKIFKTMRISSVQK